MMIDDRPETWAQVDGAIDFAVDQSARILARLRSVREASGTITSASGTLHELLQQIESTGSPSETTGMLGVARQSVQASASNLKGLNAHDLVEHLESAQRHMEELKFISMMIKIDAADPSQGSLKSAEFASDLKSLVAVLDDTTKTAVARVRPIQAKIGNAYQTLHATAVGLTRQVEEIASQKDNTDALLRARDKQMIALGREARQVSHDTADQISRLVPLLQFADAFVQRLQNTRRFIEDARQRPGTDMNDVLAVAARQIQALSEDSRAERQASIAALDALLAATSNSTRLLSTDGPSDGFGAWLQENASAVALNTEVIETSRHQLLFAFQQIDEAQAVAARVSETISTFAPLVKTLKYTAINGALLASNSSSAKGASYVLTCEVQNVGAQCRQRMTDGSAALFVINDILSRVDRSDIEARIGQLADGLDIAKAAQDSLQLLTEELGQTRYQLSQGVTELLEACRAARRTILDGETMAQDLESLIRSEGSMGTGGISADDVQWITDYYTTEPEFALHQLLFGGGVDPVVETPEADDELADFVF